ncbi:MAG: carboxypeptidase regulatory-like domain-containing protein [Saprospiraceae bacterium]|nr:carboxypeptidase regulatory-like domain-containing protein [Pyrinomonadaceae bacterium]
MFYFQSARLKLRLYSLTNVAAALSIAFLVIISCNSSAPAQTFPGTNTGAIPDGPNPINCTTAAPRNVTFSVSGVASPVASVSAGFTINHTWAGDVDVVLIAPDSTTFTLMSRVGATPTVVNAENSDLTGTYAFSDAAAGGMWAAAAGGGNAFVIPSGSYRTQASGPFTPVNPGSAFTLLNNAFTGVAAPNGTWTLRFRDCEAIITGSVSAATLTFVGASAAGASLSGRVVTSSGRGIGKTRVTLSGGSLMENIDVLTNPFGYYTFPDVPVGETYIVTVLTKRYSFAQPALVVTLNDSIVDLDFYALE